MKQGIIIAGDEPADNCIRAFEKIGIRAVDCHCCRDCCLADYQGLVLAGEGDIMPTDKPEWRLLQSYVVQDKPVLGICKGMQMINQFYGGTMKRHLPFVGLHRQKHMTIALQGSFMEELYGLRFPVNSTHGLGLETLGDGLEAVQFAEDRVVEGIRHKSLPVYGVQWHPERMENGERLLNFWIRLFPNIA